MQLADLAVVLYGLVEVNRTSIPKEECASKVSDILLLVIYYHHCPLPSPLSFKPYYNHLLHAEANMKFIEQNPHTPAGFAAFIHTVWLTGMQ